MATLPMPHAAAAPITSAKPAGVASPSSPPATSARPAGGQREPGDLGARAAARRSSTTAKPSVKNACTWSTSEARPADIPTSMPTNSSENFTTPIAPPTARTHFHGTPARPPMTSSGSEASDVAQRRQQQRREVLEPDLDDDEVEPPDRGDEDGEGDVDGAHGGPW